MSTIPSNVLALLIEKKGILEHTEQILREPEHFGGRDHSKEADDLKKLLQDANTQLVRNAEKPGSCQLVDHGRIFGVLRSAQAPFAVSNMRDDRAQEGVSMVDATISALNALIYQPQNSPKRLPGGAKP